MNARDRIASTLHWIVLLAAVPLLLIPGCQREPPEEMVREMEELRTEREELRQRADQLEEVRATLQAVRDDLRALELPDGSVMEGDPPLRTQQDTVRALVRTAGRGLEEARSRLQSAQARAATFQRRVDSLHTVHENAVTRYEAGLARERNRVGELEARTRELAQRIEALDAELTEARVAYESLDREAHRVYYVAGTRDELIRRSVVAEEGGARFLFLFWRRGEMLVPARDPDPTRFSAIDMRETREIPLPEPGARYRVVSRHDPAYLERRLEDDATVTGNAVRVTNPEEFWRPSRFLILVRQGS